jgi:quercetin dioxygenase-like cupin family protein
MRAGRLAIAVSGLVLLLVALGFGNLSAQGAPQNVPAAAAATGTDDRIVSIDDEPRHRKVYDEGTTRILDVQVPPGDMTFFHTHTIAALYVPISRSLTRTQVFGEEWRGGTGTAPLLPPGEAERPGAVTSNITYPEKSYTHRLHNLGNSLYRLIGVYNRSKGSDSDADDVSGLSAKPEIANRYYRAHRIVLAAGESNSPHRHATAVVVVQQTAGRIVSDGSAKTELTSPGMFALHEGNGMHVLRNAGNTSINVIEVEVRGATTKTSSQ